MGLVLRGFIIFVWILNRMRWMRMGMEEGGGGREEEWRGGEVVRLLQLSEGKVDYSPLSPPSSSRRSFPTFQILLRQLFLFLHLLLHNHSCDIEDTRLDLPIVLDKHTPKSSNPLLPL